MGRQVNRLWNADVEANLEGVFDQILYELEKLPTPRGEGMEKCYRAQEMVLQRSSINP